MMLPPPTTSARLHAQRVDRLDLRCEGLDLVEIEAGSLLAAQRLAGQS